MAILELAYDDLRLVLNPELGGSIMSFRKGDMDLMRPTPAGANDVLQTASFPLVPYANRIAGGRFTWGGRSGDLPRNMAGQAHPLHGEGWRGPWTVEAADATSASLNFVPQGSAWPWRYRATQRARLDGQGLTLELAVTNLDDAPGPFGLGFHPFFPDSPTARLTADTTGMWEASPDILPVREVTVSPWTQGRPVQSDTLIDHCYTGWTGQAVIELAPGKPRLGLTGSESMRWLHVYAPPDQDIFCVEPVTHAPNAVNMASPEAQGVWTLGPGETATGRMRIDIL